MNIIPISIIVLVMVMCLHSVSFSHQVSHHKQPQKCIGPNGEDRAVRITGCIKTVCINGKWNPKMRTDICCYKHKVYQPHTVVTTLAADDGCTRTTIHCKPGGNFGFTQTNDCIHQLERQIININKTNAIEVDELKEKVKGVSLGLKNLTDLLDNLITERNEVSKKMMETVMNPSQLLNTKTRTSTPDHMVEGILITGGSDNQNTNRSASKSTEVFLPHSGKTCSLESLPGPKLFSTMDLVSGTPVLCGGDRNNPGNCLQFLQTSKKGLWISFANLQHKRYEHSSWASPDGLILFGGSGSDYSTEIVGGGKGFNLNENTLLACAIPIQSSMILTGGNKSPQVVVSYSLQGFAGYLPELSQGRYSHACGYYKKGSTKVLLVAGGYARGVGSLASTEVLFHGSESWQAGESLPRKIYYAASANLESGLLLIGGYSGGARDEVLMYNGTWSEVGRMQLRRWGASASPVMIDTTGPVDISGCS